MDGVNWHTFFFYLFSLVACGFAVAVVLASNIVRMALFLIISLGSTAGLFFLAGADFVGAMQLMIYVGGTLVLLVFGVMLTASGPFVSMKTASGDWVVACLVSGCLLGPLALAAFSIPAWRGPAIVAAADESPAEPAAVAASKTSMASVEPTEGAAVASGPAFQQPVQENTATLLGEGLLGARVDKLHDVSPRLKPGMSGYLLPFEIVSVHLLVVLVGAAYLARTKRRRAA